MKFFKKLTAFILILNLLSSGLAPGLSGTAYAAVTGHWAADTVNKWISEGRIQDSAALKSKLDTPVSRAEILSLLDSVFKLRDKEVVDFYDVPANAGYADAVYKAVTAGIIKGYDDGTFRPNASISRQEAAVLMVKAFDLKVKDGNAAQKYSDYSSIPQWSREAIAILAENNYLSAKAGNRFAPVDSLTYGEAITMMDIIAGKIVADSGTYSGKMPGNLLLNTTNITLDNVSVQGNLILAQGIGDGQITLNKVAVLGNLIIRGGGENSIYLNNTTVDGTLVINKKDGQVRVVAKGSTGISNTQVCSGAVLREESLTGKGFGNIDVPKEALWGSLIKLDGSFGTVSVSAPGTSLRMQEGANVSTLEIKTGAKDSTIQSYGQNIGAISLRAKTNVALYKGTLGKLEAQENALASGISIEGAAVGAMDIRAKSRVDILSGSVKTLDIDERASGTSVYVGGGAAVTTFNANGNADVTGQGNIQTANINAENVIIEKRPAVIVVATGVSSVIGGRVTTISDTPYSIADDSQLTAMLTTPTAGYTTSQLVITFSRPLSASTLAINDRSKLLSSIVYSGTALSAAAQTGSVSWSGTVDMPVATIYTTSTRYEADRTVTVNFLSGVIRDISGNSLSSESISVTVKENVSGVLAMSSTYGTAGQKNQNLILTYSPGEALERGSVSFILPAGFAASSLTDTVSVAGYAETPVTPDQVENAGQRVTIKDLTISQYQSIVLRLNGKTVPAAGYYNFTVQCDPDGSGTQRMLSPGTGNELKTFVSAAGTGTVAGRLEVAPTSVQSETTENVVLMYTASEMMANGTVTFILPSGFSAGVASDTVSIAGGSAVGLASGQITNSGHTVTVYDVSMLPGQRVILNLNGKSMPVTGTYQFSAAADADGPAGPRAPSPGTGIETAVLTSGASGATIPGRLDIAPGVGYANVSQNIALTYTLGENMTNGTVAFVLPQGFTADTGDTVSIAGASPVSLSINQTGGGTVIVPVPQATAPQTVVLTLNGIVVPGAGEYIFKAVADADGPAVGRTPSVGTGDEQKTFVSSVGRTAAGSLGISPNSGWEMSSGTIVLTYRLGEAYSEGTVVFSLPSGFTAAVGADTYTVAGGTPAALIPDQISPDSRKVTITGITTTGADETVVLTLNNKTIPAENTYNFAAVGDADGSRPEKAATLGIGNEIAVFASNIDLWTVAINPAAGLINGTKNTMEYKIDTIDGVNGSWTACSYPYTSVSMNLAKKVYVRSAARPDIWRIFEAAPAPAVTADLSQGQHQVKLMDAVAGTMEYSRDGGLTWSPVAEAIALGTQTIDVSTAPGNDLRVRLKATDTVLASLPTNCLNSLVDLDPVDINVPLGSIMNTNSFMEYSLNSTTGRDGTWSICSGPVTLVSFTPGNVYVRARLQPTNYRLVTGTPIVKGAAPAAYLEPAAQIEKTKLMGLFEAGREYEYVIDSNATLAENAAGWNWAATIPAGVTSVDNITADGTKYIHIRIKMTQTQLSSAIQNIDVRTADLKPASMPLVKVNNPAGNAEKIRWISDSSAVTGTAGLEYNLRGTGWKDVNETVTLDLSTYYTLYVRYKETQFQPASDIWAVATTP